MGKAGSQTLAAGLWLWDCIQCLYTDTAQTGQGQQNIDHAQEAEIMCFG